MADNLREEGEEEEEEEGIMKEQEMLLPIANIGRLMKQTVPPNAKISKEAKETMQESVSEFIAFVTSEASNKCRRERRKTVNGDDICWAFTSLGFDNYALALRRYLHRFRVLEGDRHSSALLENDRSEPSEEDQIRWNHQWQAAPVTGVVGGSSAVSTSGQMMSFAGKFI